MWGLPSSSDLSSLTHSGQSEEDRGVRMHLSHIVCLSYTTCEEPGIGQAFWERSRAETGWKRICPEFRVVGWIQCPQEAANEELLGSRLELTTAADRCFGTMLAKAGKPGA